MVSSKGKLKLELFISSAKKICSGFLEKFDTLFLHDKGLLMFRHQVLSFNDLTLLWNRWEC